MRPLASVMGRARRPARSAVVAGAALAAGLVVLALWLEIDRLENARYLQQERARLTQMVAARAMRLNQVLAERTFTVHALELLPRHDPDFDAGEFRRHAASIAAPQDIRALQLAPGGIIRHVYPRQGNEAATGLDLLSLPGQAEVTRRTIRDRATVLAGPEPLRQGGRGLLVRRPVFLEGGAFWGLAIAVIDLEGFLAAGGWPWPDNGLDWALRGRDGLGAGGDLIAGDAAVFDRAPVVTALPVPGGEWELAAVPRGGWAGARPGADLFRGLGAGLAVLAAMAVWAIGRLVLARDQRESDLRRSEENLRRMFEASPQPMLVVDSDGGWLVRGNAAAQGLLALDGESGRVVQLADFFEDARDAERILAGVPQGGVQVECRIRDAAGRLHWVLMAAMPVAYDGARVLIVSLTDISDRRRAEERLRQLSQAVEHAPASVVITDRKGRITYVNPMFTTVTGYRPREVVGRNPRILASGLTPQAHYRQMWNTILGGEVWRGEFINRRKDGTLYWEAAAIAPVTDHSGGISHFVAVKTDVTAQKEAEERLRQAKEQAEQGMRARSEFLAMMSHEIRTPMNGIVGMIRLLQDTELTPTQHEYVEVVRHSSDALINLLNDILDFSKLEAGKLTLEDEEFDLDQLVRAVVALMGPRAEEKGLRMEMQMPEDMPRHLRGDPARLRQVLLNLVGNAIKFTEEGKVVVTVRARPVGNGRARLHVAVADTGVGVREDVRERLFAQYEQGDSGVARRFGGTGLGLAICKRIISLMGGRIDVDSQAGEGSTFWFEVDLPIAEGAPAGDEAPVAAPGHRRALRILLAEDNVINQKVAVGLLTRAGHQVTVAPDGAAAVQAVAKHDFDLVLMDMEMPGVSGLDATRQIRALPGARRRVPIVAMTANVMKRDEERCFAAGMDGYLAKPIDTEALERMLYRISASAAVADAFAHASAAEAGDRSNPEVIDSERVEELRDVLGAGYFDTLLDDYLAFAIAKQQALAAATPQDRQTLHALAHEIAGTAGNFGLAAVAGAAETALAALHEGDGDAIARQLDILRHRLTETEHRLRALKAAQPSD